MTGDDSLGVCISSNDIRGKEEPLVGELVLSSALDSGILL
jgi:hypothetical protein